MVSTYFKSSRFINHSKSLKTFLRIYLEVYSIFFAKVKLRMWLHLFWFFVFCEHSLIFFIFEFILQASYLSTLGGTGTTLQVNRILRFLLTNELATKYNFAGQRTNKQAFGTTRVKSVIVSKWRLKDYTSFNFSYGYSVLSTGAVQIKSPATTQEVENAIKTWLKHARQRMEKKLVPNRT